MSEAIEPVIYQFKVALRRISLMIWRPRLLVRSDGSIADPHSREFDVREEQNSRGR